MRRLTPLLLLLVAAGPADQLPDPKPERCIPLLPIETEDEAYMGEGLAYPEVAAALNAVIQTALLCGQPEGMKEVHLTFDLTVGCDGLVSKIEAVDEGGAPADYVTCVGSVIGKADFPAHDREAGMLVTYPVDVVW
jgi:hypothetical protein